MERIPRSSQPNSYVEADGFSISFALKVAKEAAFEAGKIVRQDFGKIPNVSWKCDIEVQTETDKKAEQFIIAFIKDYFPKHSIFGEEFGLSRENSPYTWIIDPLDGTNNFVLDIPQFSVCVSLKEDDDVLLAVVHHPITGNTYTAVKGEGAYLNGKKIDLLKERDIQLNKSTICSILAYSVHSNPLRYFIFNQLYNGTRRLLDTWAPSLDWCLLATGKIDALVYLSDIDYQDDPGMLAGAFLFSEAGGLIRKLDLRGNGEAVDALRGTSIIAASSKPMIHQVNGLIKNASLVEEPV